ncbi:glutamyl-tRNA reductase [Marinoscillum sp. MHG1-6]|uniref:glutamyl-tRNA reductase n=1 Tax=Marinoscillum sp. MHG1-6 TaxID=2959627 RepID=UPI0021584FAE|nr:glutamyl-tRNA reductase [Marinoscillum sp. MHG1-6]
MSELKYIGIDYKKADVNVRGLFALNPAERANMYIQLKEYFGLQEALILSTCNRTEVYYVHKKDIGEQIVALLVSIKGLVASDYLPYFHLNTDGTEAITHLFRMAIGLESQVLGDIQIFGQVKQAYQEAADADMAEATLHRALHTLFYTHKQVCQETAFKTGAASTSYNAVKILKENDIASGASVLVVGAGKIGSDVCKNLTDLGFSNVTVTNRTQQRADSLAKELNLKTTPYKTLYHQLTDYSVIIGAAGSDEPIFKEKLTGDKSNTRFFILDLCAPNSFSDLFIMHHGAQYYNIDRIGSLQEETIMTRSLEVPKVEQIIEATIREWKEWVEEYGQTREIKKFKKTLDEIRQQCLAEYMKKTDEAHHGLIEQVAESLINKIVKIPAVQIKTACQRDRAEELGSILNELFNLEYPKKSKSKSKSNQL